MQAIIDWINENPTVKEIIKAIAKFVDAILREELPEFADIIG